MSRLITAIILSCLTLTVFLWDLSAHAKGSEPTILTWDCLYPWMNNVGSDGTVNGAASTATAAKKETTITSKTKGRRATKASSTKMVTPSAKETIDVGLTIKHNGETLYITTVVPGSAADQSGIAPGDLIKKINGLEAAKRYNADDAVKVLNGPEGTSVELEVWRPVGGYTNVTLVRRKTAPKGEFELVTRDGYVELKILNFGDNLSSLLPEKLKAIDWAKMRGLIIDVRTNPAGHRKGLEALLSAFIKKGTTYANYKYGIMGKEENYAPAILNGMQYVPDNVPVGVLLNEGVTKNIYLMTFVLQRHRTVVVVRQGDTRGKNDLSANFDLQSPVTQNVFAVCAEERGIKFESVTTEWKYVPATQGQDSAMKKAKELLVH